MHLHINIRVRKNFKQLIASPVLRNFHSCKKRSYTRTNLKEACHGKLYVKENTRLYGTAKLSMQLLWLKQRNHFVPVLWKKTGCQNLQYKQSLVQALFTKPAHRFSHPTSPHHHSTLFLIAEGTYVPLPKLNSEEFSLSSSSLPGASPAKCSGFSLGLLCSVSQVGLGFGTGLLKYHVL